MSELAFGRYRILFNHHKQIISTIEAASLDERFASMTPFYAEDWHGYVSKLNLRASCIELMSLLDQHHTKLSHGFYGAGGSGEKINPATLALWLTLRAKVAGAEEAYSSLLALESCSKITSYNVTFIQGLAFDGSIDFGDGIQLSCFQNLPDGIKGNVNRKLQSRELQFRFPHAFLYQPMPALLLTSEREETVFSQVSSYIESESSIINFLSLFTEAEAPCIDRRWCILDDATPMSGIVDNNYTQYLEIRPPRGIEDFNGVSLTDLLELYTKYLAIPISRRLPIDISIWRRAQAMNSWSDINKAIDLGIALEAVLTSPKTRDQLSLQIRVVGAKLSSTFLAKRSEAYAALKCIYNIRSEAVHNGRVERTYKIKGKTPQSTHVILDEGLTLLGNCLREIIARNGITAEDIDKLLLE